MKLENLIRQAFIEAVNYSDEETILDFSFYVSNTLIELDCDSEDYECNRRALLKLDESFDIMANLLSKLSDLISEEPTLEERRKKSEKRI